VIALTLFGHCQKMVEEHLPRWHTDCGIMGWGKRRTPCDVTVHTHSEPPARFVSESLDTGKRVPHRFVFARSMTPQVN
jgi:hypothetical protein